MTLIMFILATIGLTNVIVHGIDRFRIVRFIAREPYIKAEIELLRPTGRRTKKRARIGHARIIGSSYVTVKTRLRDVQPLAW